ncbi:hypothetical protein HPP92_011943 [Vanilla planifolia]|uniref:Uncharacterized protein n=1 Tax=Vanilla planifolia TaxID=51239 RepID=A0A835R3R2_VANPL|nr:hypothetical protein HPP92_011943 [Vanilla planifolia]
MSSDVQLVYGDLPQQDPVPQWTVEPSSLRWRSRAAAMTEIYLRNKTFGGKRRRRRRNTMRRRGSRVQNPSSPPEWE